MHVDPDLLALLALGEQVASGSDRAHLAACAQCRDELQNLTRAAAIGRMTLDAGELIEPAPRVWSRIAEELTLRDAGPIAPVVQLTARRRRRWLPALVAAAAVVVASGGVLTWVALRPAPVTVLASATLDAYLIHEHPDESLGLPAF